MREESVRAGRIPARPLLKPWYRVADAGESTLFHFGRSLVAVTGPNASGMLRKLLPLLDGTRNPDEIAAQFPSDQQDVVTASIQLMNARQLLLDGPIDMSTSKSSGQTAEFLGAALGQPMHPNRAASAVTRAVVGIIGSTRTANVVLDLLSNAGCHVRALGTGGWQTRAIADLTMLVAAPAGDEVDRLPETNQACMETRVPWLQILPFDGDCAIVGPIYVPRQTCCYDCFRLRRQSNSLLARLLRSFDGQRKATPTAEAVEHLLAGFAALVALRWLLSPEIERPGRAFAVQFGSQMSFEVHTVYRVPRCTTCSTPLPVPAVRTLVSPSFARLGTGVDTR